MNRHVLGTAFQGAALAAALFFPAVCFEALAQEEGPVRLPGTITVSGTGRIGIAPDRATVSLGVESEAREASDALLQNNQQMHRLLDALHAAGVEAGAIQTQAIQLRPRYDQPSRASSAHTGPELAGYTAVNVVQITSRDLGDLGRILDAAVRAGGNRVEGIQLEVDDPSQALDQAREAAWKDGRRKAEQLATLAGRQLERVVTVTESSLAPAPVLRMAAMESASAVPIEPGRKVFEVTLQVTWQIN
jgi:uncharacterized protein YggE